MSEPREPQEPNEPTEPTAEAQRIAELEASVGRLEGALANERDAHKATKTKASTALSEEDQAEFDRLREEEQKRKDEEMIPMARVNEMVEERSNELVKAANKERDEAVEASKATTGQLDEFVLSDAIHKGAGQVEDLQSGVVQDIIDLAASGRLKGVNFVRDGLKVELQDDNGIALPAPDGEGNMQMHHWIGSDANRQARSHWFKPNTGGGPGPGSGGGEVPPGTKKTSDMTPSEKAAFMREHGADAYLKAAGVS